MRVLVCGDREWTDYEIVFRVLRELRPSVIIEGGAHGADHCARRAAPRVTAKPSLRFDADWKTHGKAAGPIRNQRMLDEGKPDLVVAFHDDLGRSKGTNDMLARAERANIPTRLINHRQQDMKTGCAS
jgi:hypothetical protein